VLREAVRQGNELGNHSTSHTALPDRGDIGETSRLIERATGTVPCLFRPPNGDTSPELLRDVRRLGMSTIAWDVDTGDWADQSPADIRARVMATVHPGSIILLHDGGGDRSGTARAVSGVIDDLHSRDYRIVTVSRLFADSRKDLVRPDSARADGAG
jgi:peptidoglycan/xylan/chitin deacetylase (PgdA/CDA1 family)